MKPEYHEGPNAVAKVEKMMARLFRASKPTAKKSAKPPPKRETTSKD